MVPLLHHTLEEFLLFVPVTLASLYLEILMPKEATENETTMLTGVIDLDYQEDIGLLIHKEGREIYLEPKEFTGYLLVLTCPVVPGNGKL